MYLLSKRYLQKVFIYQYFHINSEIQMQYAILTPHACMLCLLSMHKEIIINYEKCMTGQERQSCTFHAHILFSVYIVSFFQTSYLSMIHFCSSMVKATSADLRGFGGKPIQSHQENGSSLVTGS